MSKPSGYFLQILRLARPFWPWTLGVSLSIVLASFIRQIPPQIQRGLVDYLTQRSLPTWFGFTFSFTTLLLAWLLVIIFVSLLDRLIWSISHRFNVRFRFSLRQLAYDKLLGLSIPYYNRQQSGSLMSKVDRGASQISGALNNLSANILPNIVAAIIALFIVIAIRWEIALFISLSFLLYFPMRYRRFTLIAKLDRITQRLWDKEYGHFYEAIGSIRLVKSFVAEPFESNRFRRFGRKIIYYADQEDRIENKYIFANLFLNLMLWSVYAYVFYLGLVGAFTLGTVILLIEYVNMIRQPFTSLEWTFWEIKRAQVGARDYFKILNAHDASYQADRPIVLDQIKGNIEFQDVSFTYPEKGGEQVFKNLSLTIEPGQTLAVVGRSGAGKTTLAHLLVRFFDPDSGRLLIDGHDIKELDLRFLRQNIGLVMQESYLFGDTVAENLRYGKPDGSLAEMKIAAKIAHAHEFINRFPDKYQTLIGERGIKLSGGQQQRLSIARTILKNPPILILDEATSALDSRSERLVQSALWKLIQGRTTIIIAHRLSTVQRADQIIVLDKKKILEQGTHEELLKKGRIYASLHRIQAGLPVKLREWDLVS